MSSEPGGGGALLEAWGRAVYAASNWGNEGENFKPAFFVDIGRDFVAEIEAAGYVIVKAEQLLWLQQSNDYGSRWAAEHPLPAEGER